MRNATFLSLGFFLAFFGCPSFSRSIEPDKSIAPDTVFVGFVRPRLLMTSALVKSQGWDELLKTLIATNGLLQEFLENAGINPLTQIDSVLVTSTVFPILVNPSQEESQKFKPSALVAIRGTFQSKKVIKALETLGKENGAPVKRVKVDDLTLWELPVPGMPVYVAIHNQQKTIFLATRKEDAVACLRGGFAPLKSKEIKQALAVLGGKEVAYLAGTMPPKKPENLSLDPELQKLTEQVEGWSIGAEVSDSIHLGLNLVTQEGNTTATLRDALEKKWFPYLRQEIAGELEARPKGEEKGDLGNRVLRAYLEVLKKIRVSTEGNILELSFTLNEGLLDSILGKEEKKP
jgi:hypothetical protein